MDMSKRSVYGQTVDLPSSRIFQYVARLCNPKKLNINALVPKQLHNVRLRVDGYQAGMLIMFESEWSTDSDSHPHVVGLRLTKDTAVLITLDEAKSEIGAMRGCVPQICHQE